MQLILLANILLSIGAIAGISVFASQTNDVFILTDTYGFYWFVSTVSLLIGIVGYAYHQVDYVRQQFPKSEYSIYGMALMSLLFTVFWLAASASMVSLLRNCLQIKNMVYSRYYYNNYVYNYTCNGQIMTTTFGFSLFILWCVVSYILAIKLFSRLQQTKNPESLEMKQPEVEHIQVQQVQAEQDQVNQVQTNQVQTNQVQTTQVQTNQTQVQEEVVQVVQVEQVQVEQVQEEVVQVDQLEEVQLEEVQLEEVQVEQEPLQVPIQLEVM